MTAAVYRWLLDQIEGITGEDALVYVGVISFLSVAAGYAIYELGAYLRKRFGTWHDRVTLKGGPIRYEDRFL